MSNAVLDFILALFRDEDALARYCENPDLVLAEAGLTDVCHADIVAVAPLVADTGLFAGSAADLTAALSGAGTIAGTAAAGLVGGAGLGAAAGAGLGLGAGLGGGVRGR